ncbi:MAG: hypothetical protein KAJ60_01570 [Desulfobulbaceae bacterium]|nr:hypothetical protein [Desulfobulbaceae bacterium]
MSHRKDLQELHAYIDNFDTEEFTSTEEFKKSLAPTDETREKARKMRARLDRKKKMSETIIHLELEELEPPEIITQEQIDALLSHL